MILLGEAEQAISPDVLKLWAAGLAFIGVVLSIVVSAAFTLYRIEAEKKKQKREITNTFAAKLQEERLAVYPKLYSFVYRFDRKMQQRDATYEDLVELHEGINAWNLESGILMGFHCRHVYYGFFRELSKFVAKGPDWVSKHLADKEWRIALTRREREFGLALQADIGIFDAEFFERGKRFSSYDERRREAEDSDSA